MRRSNFTHGSTEIPIDLDAFHIFKYFVITSLNIKLKKLMSKPVNIN